MLVVGLVVTREHCDLSARVDRHDAATVANIDDVGHVIDDHDYGGARARSLWTNLLARHGILSSSLSHLNQVDKAALAVFESTNYGFLGEFGEIFVLNNEVVQVVAQVVGTGRTAVAIKDTEEADLGPLDVKVLLALWLENVQNDRDSVLIVVSNDTLVSIGSVGLNHSTFLLRRFGRFVIFEEQCLGVEHGRILSKEQGLNLHELNVTVLRVRARQTGGLAALLVRLLVRVPCVDGHLIGVWLVSRILSLLTGVTLLGLRRLVVLLVCHLW